VYGGGAADAARPQPFAGDGAESGVEALSRMIAEGGDGGPGSDQADVFRRILSDLHADPSTAGGAVGGIASPDADGGAGAAAAAPSTPAAAPSAAAGTTPASAAAAATAPAAPAGASPAPLVDPQSLGRLLAGLGAGAGAAPAGPHLTDIVTADAAGPVFDTPEVCEALLPLLPEGDRTAGKARELLRTPQFRQALGHLGGAIERGEAHSVLANFGLASASEELNGEGGPVEAFLRAVQAHAKKQEEEKQQQEKEQGAEGGGDKMEEG
jgi:hypothetical protein